MNTAIKDTLCIAWLLVLFVVMTPVVIVMSIFTPYEKLDDLGQKAKRFLQWASWK